MNVHPLGGEVRAARRDPSKKKNRPSTGATARYSWARNQVHFANIAAKGLASKTARIAAILVDDAIEARRRNKNPFDRRCKHVAEVGGGLGDSRGALREHPFGRALPTVL